MSAFFSHLFSELNYWQWLGLGIVLLILEMLFTTGGFLLWIGLAALVMALAVWIFPDLFWGTQLFLFATASIVCLVGWWSYLQRRPTHTDRPTLNRRSEQYIGRMFVLETPIENGRGTIRVDDTTWRVAGDDLPANTKVKVTAVNGVILQVEKVD